MRWRNSTYDWRPWFAWYPVSINGENIWLEWIERRFSGDCYEIRTRPTPCPYCDKVRNRQECIDESMAKQFLPACASGPRDDAPESEKRQFQSWIAQGPSFQPGQTRKEEAMTQDFESMPIGTAQLLRDLANWLRVKHLGFVALADSAAEKAGQSTGWRHDAFVEDMDKAEARANDIAEQIGSIEALLDRCPHAPPLEPVG